MSIGVNRFYDSLKDAGEMSDRDLVSLFLYHLTVEMGEGEVTARRIVECFVACRLTPPARVAAYLSEGVNAREFVKMKRGYQLHRVHRDKLADRLGVNKAVAQTSIELRKIEAKLVSGIEKSFLSETIDCFEAGANRAAIILCWILAIDHLSDYVFRHHLIAFNDALAKVTDRRVKTDVVRAKDDFGDIPEAKFIELLRASNIISNDVRKILDEKLGTRNSCAHPSGIAIKPSKVVEFIDDLIENVILKYTI